MAFHPAVFEAEFGLGMIPSEDMPMRAQDALEAGFDGPGIVRMAVLERPSGWEVDQIAPRMLQDLGLQRIGCSEAALRLARVRAERILATGEAPFASSAYFHALLLAADYPSELIGVAYMDDALEYAPEEEVRKAAVEQLEELLDSDLAARRRAERQAAWEEQKRRSLADWPYVFNSPGGRRLLRERFREELAYKLSMLWIGLSSWLVLSWLDRSWVVLWFGVPFVTLTYVAGALFTVYRTTRRERRDRLFRMGFWK